MLRKSAIAIFAVVLLTGITGISNLECAGKPGAPSADKACDRECLEGFVTKYLEAMIAHDPESLPVSESVKFTEDCREIKLGVGKVSGKIYPV